MESGNLVVVLAPESRMRADEVVVRAGSEAFLAGCLGPDLLQAAKDAGANCVVHPTDSRT